jgi:hypothetical protein
MKRALTLVLTGANSKQQLTRGNLNLDKGKKAMGVYLKMTVPIANATGGALASGLSDARRQLLFAAFTLWANYGRDGRHKPFEGLDLRRIHRLARFCLGSEIEGYSDTSTGLARNLPDAATTNVVFYMFVPLGFLWMLQPQEARLFGMGRSQAKSLQLEIQQTTTAIDTGITIGGNVTVEVIPATESTKGDPWGAVPHWAQNDTTNDEIEGPEGLPLLVTERTAVHASSSLTSINVKIDEEVIHEAMSPQDTIVQYNDQAFATSAGSLTDRETVLYAVGPSAAGTLADLPTGKPSIKQVVKNLSTFLAGYFYLPTITDNDVEQALLFVTQESRKKEVKATAIRAVRGGKAPARVDASLGFIVLDKDDSEWEQVPGFAMKPGESKMRLVVPEALRIRAQKTLQAHRAEGESKAAEKVVEALAAAVPGSVPGARGFSRGGSAVLERVAQALG